MFVCLFESKTFVISYNERMAGDPIHLFFFKAQPPVETQHVLVLVFLGGYKCEVKGALLNDSNQCFNVG